MERKLDEAEDAADSLIHSEYKQKLRLQKL